LLVSRRQRLRYLLGDRQEVGQGDRSICELVRECWAFDELEYEGNNTVCVVKAVDGRDIPMVHRREQLGLALQTLDELWVRGDVGRQHFDGHIALQLSISRTIDFSHSTEPERPENGVGSELRARRDVSPSSAA